jgi:hypothetical protein
VIWITGGGNADLTSGPPGLERNHFRTVFDRDFRIVLLIKNRLAARTCPKKKIFKFFLESLAAALWRGSDSSNDCAPNREMIGTVWEENYHFVDQLNMPSLRATDT